MASDGLGKRRIGIARDELDRPVITRHSRSPARRQRLLST